MSISIVTKEKSLPEVYCKGDMITRCNNMGLTDTSICLWEYVLTFYKYNETNVASDLTFEELKELGGVCSHYNLLYKQLGESLGFQGKEVIIMSDDKKLSHIFTVLYDGTGYCIMDQDVLPRCILTK